MAVRISGTCPDCRRRLVRKERKADGTAFLGCSGFPTCKFTEGYDEYLNDLVLEIESLRDQLTEARSTAGRTNDRELRSVIAFAHPDKWPSAQDLAHGVVSRLNALRGRS